MDLQDLKSCFYFFNGTFAYLGKTTDTDFHSHHALQISIGLNRSFLLETQTKSGNYQAIIIDTDISHRLDCMGNWNLILLIEPEHESARQIKENILTGQTSEPDFLRLKPHVNNIVRLMVQKATCMKIKNSLDLLLAELTGLHDKPRETDQRIVKIFRYIENLEEKKVSLETLADLVKLSESRLAHIFKEQTGIPVRRYILWVRLMDALENITQGRSLTVAAHNAGFSDSAHLTRTFKRMFGVIPSMYLTKTNSSRFIQLINCSG